MRADHIMTRKVTTVKADTPIRDAANLMLQQHISGLPVVDGSRPIDRHGIGRGLHPPQRDRHAASADQVA